MVKEFYPLEMSSIGDTRYLLNPSCMQSPPDLYSSALLVMTDFLKAVPITVSQDTQVDQALAFMKNQQVRLLFAMDARQHLSGIITARDLTGSEVLSYMETSRMSRAEMTVKDLMLPIDQAQVLAFEEVEQARIGDLMKTLSRAGSAHLIVVDRGVAGVERIRGIVSVSDISRVLHKNFEVISESGSFAAKEWVLKSIQRH